MNSTPGAGTEFKRGIDVVVVNYRTFPDLQGFYQSLLDSQTEVPFSLWVVNVDPTDLDVEKTWECLKKSQVFPSTHLVFKSNVGYAKGCNFAGKLGNREVLALFNADTRLSPSTLDSCFYALQSREDWGVLGPRQVDSRNRLTHAGIVGTLEKPKFRAWRTEDRGQFKDVNDTVVTVSGSAYFIKRLVWNELTSCPLFRAVAPDAHGAFLPTQHYYEETYCSYHAQAHGYKCVYYGPDQMKHFWHSASSLGEAEKHTDASREYFRRACEVHGIPHD